MRDKRIAEMDPELWEKYSDDWRDRGANNLAYVLMWAGPENFPHLHLDEAQHDPHVTFGDHLPFYDHIDEVLEDLYIKRSLDKDTPLTNRDLFEIARDANASLAEHYPRAI